MVNYRQINYVVMTDTKRQYETIPELQEAVYHSVHSQFMISHEEDIHKKPTTEHNTNIVISGKRSFEAAKGYKGKKVAVLNFANNHSIGGAPFSAGAQEESLCRCSTLYPCLQAMKHDFYEKHIRQFETHQINHMGNDDLIYTPGVAVFKTDERTEPIYPKMMEPQDWYFVDVITSAAPELWRGNARPVDYEAQITSRINKILDVAAREGVQVLILGAWGCGAFCNPSDVVAKVFMTQLKNYNFETVEFALATRGDLSTSTFARALGVKEESTKDKFISLLRSTSRENIEMVIHWLEANSFFDAPASVKHHNNFRGGLVKHSMEVCEEALKLHKEANLPKSSIILCSLLHDVCKADQYVMFNGQPASIRINLDKGHGKRSMYILKRRCLLPLNYDEEMAIWWHMGEYEPSKDTDSKEYLESQNIELCRLIQKADGIAAHKG